jgi:hypothetical protein
MSRAARWDRNCSLFRLQPDLDQLANGFDRISPTKALGTSPFEDAGRALSTQRLATYCSTNNGLKADVFLATSAPTALAG